jgi:hypothetical protein
MPSAGPHRHVRRGRDRRAASGVVRKWGMDVPTRSVSSSEGEVERGRLHLLRLPLVWSPLSIEAWQPY